MYPHGMQAGNKAPYNVYYYQCCGASDNNISSEIKKLPNSKREEENSIKYYIPGYHVSAPSP
jgi:hypothetical protein